MKILNFRHAGLVTTNLEESLNFYVNLLGMKKIRVIDESKTLMKKLIKIKNCNLITVKLGLNNKVFLELLYFKDLQNTKKKIKISTPGLTHISITVKNLNQMYKKLKKEKIKFLSKPQFSHDKKVKLAFCKSPENIFIELVEVV